MTIVERVMWNRLIYFLTSFYGVSRSEAVGFTVLIPILLIVTFIPLWYRYVKNYETRDHLSYFESFQAWVKESEASIQNEKTSVPDQGLSTSEAYFEFDPNSSTVEELKTLGFKPWIAERMVKYRNAGGRFRSFDDIKKIYGISEEHLEVIRPFVRIDEHADKKIEQPTVMADESDYPIESEVSPKMELRNINTAVAEDLVFIRGIGPVLSERIVKYRDMLGGFALPDQINEVYGLDSAVADSIRRYFYIDTTAVSKLDINHLKAEELRKHPYVNYKLANALEQYRIQHGRYGKPDDLLAIKILDDSTFQKILPYLKID